MFRKALAILAFFVGTYGFYSSYAFENLTSKSKGVVVGYHVQGDKTKPVIEYKICRRQVMRLDLNVLFFSEEFEMGQRVNVRYDPDNPIDADIPHMSNSWVLGFVSISLSMMFWPGNRWSRDDGHFYVGSSYSEGDDNGCDGD